MVLQFFKPCLFFIIACITERFVREETKKHFQTITVSCNKKCRDADKKFQEGKENLFAEFGL